MKRLEILGELPFGPLGVVQTPELREFTHRDATGNFEGRFVVVRSIAVKENLAGPQSARADHRSQVYPLSAFAFDS